MNFDDLKRAINIRETIKLYFSAIGKYREFIRAYAQDRDKIGAFKWRNEKLHDEVASTHEPLIRHVCGDWWGYNPNNPAHPMRKFFNEHFCKEA